MPRDAPPPPSERFISVDLSVHLIDHTEAEDPSTAIKLNDAQSPHAALLRDALKITANVSGPPVSSVIVRFVFSVQDGYVVRCDLLERRLEGCPFVLAVKSFLNPLQYISSASPDFTFTPKNTWDLVERAVGGILYLDSTPDHQTQLRLLDRELVNRMSVPWVTKQPIPRRRIVWIQGREDFESIHRAYEAAWALGITLVIVDQPGHWLEDDHSRYAYLREAFIPASIDVDAGFPQRIVDVVKCYPLPVDGIVTISDVRLPGIALATEMLGLPTSPSDAHKVAGDKGSTRLMETETDGDFVAVVSSLAELDDILDKNEGELPYPLIVKPCLGWNSDCVAKVRSLEQLREAVRRASERHASSPSQITRAVIEPYIDGPEVDANLILLNGEILFFQVSDDFPSTGDTLTAARSDEAAAAPNFMETIMMLPSGLPEDEQLVLRESLKESVLRQGFTNGVIHCEARVRNSRTRYEARADNGLVDLHVPEKKHNTPAACYLHEINARPPGYFSSVSVMLAHGVDYYAVRLLFAIGDEERIRTLSMPFLSGTQYTLGIAILSAARTGIMETPDAVLEMMEKHPWMKEWIVDHQTMRKGGTKVFGPEESQLWYLGYASVASRLSRKECLERIQAVQDNFAYKLVGE